MRLSFTLIRLLLTFLAASLTFVCLDLLFLGPVMGWYYQELLGDLMADPVRVDAAGYFYVFYLSFIVQVAVYGATSSGNAFYRGAAMGLFAYGTFEFTNWAVIEGWPSGLVAVDMAWGTFLTGSVAFMARLVYERFGAKHAEAD